jgi:hypothetical protein
MRVGSESRPIFCGCKEMNNHKLSYLKFVDYLLGDFRVWCWRPGLPKVGIHLEDPVRYFGHVFRVFLNLRRKNVDGGEGEEERRRKLQELGARRKEIVRLLRARQI